MDGISIGDAILNIVGDWSGASKTVAEFKQKTEMSVSDLSRSIGAGMTVAGGVLTGFFAMAVKGSMESEEQQAKLASSIKSTGGAAGYTMESANKLIDSLSKMAAVDDEVVTSGVAVMMTFTKVGHEIFPQAMTAALDLSRKLGMDLQSAVVLVGKALQDPIKGISALHRVGVDLQPAQKKQIEDFMKVNDVAAAQKVILGELGVEMGGSAAAYAETLSGKWTNLKTSFGNLMESIGKALTDGKGFDGLIEKITAIIDKCKKWVDENPELASTITKVAFAVGVIATALGPLLFMLPGIVVAFGAIPFVAAGVGAAFLACTGPVGLIILALIAAVAAAYYVYTHWDEIKAKAIELWEGFKVKVEQIWVGLKERIAEEVRNIGYAIGYGLARILEYLYNPIGAIKRLWGEIVGIFQWAWQGIVEAWDWGLAKLSQIGDALMQIVSGPFNAIKGAIGWLADLFGGGMAAGAGAGMAGYARGTSFHPGGLAALGEEGPELVYGPQIRNLARGSMVMNAQETARMMQGGQGAGGNAGPQLTFNIQPAALYVREEADVTRVSQELYRRIRSEAASRGVSLGGLMGV